MQYTQKPLKIKGQLHCCLLILKTQQIHFVEVCADHRNTNDNVPAGVSDLLFVIF